MNLNDFRVLLEQDAPPNDMGHALQALWHQAKGDWETAHQLAQSEDEGRGAWVHAFLHRVEGDDSNAAYWYRRAGKPLSSARLSVEWEGIVAALLRD